MKIKKSKTLTNQEIIAALPTAREIFAVRVEDIVDNFCRLSYGRITFEEVRAIAEVESHVPAVVEALIRVIECNYTITLEVV